MTNRFWQSLNNPFFLTSTRIDINELCDRYSFAYLVFTDDSRLSKRALKSFEGTTKDGRIIVPAAVMAEILFISRKGRVALGFLETIARIEAMDNFEIAPLDLDVLRMASSIETDLEMHDKLIVATALCYDAALITRDEQITRSKTIKTIW